MLDGAFTALRRNPRATLGLAAMVMTVYGIITASATLVIVHLVKGVAMPASGQTLTSAQARQLLEHFGEVVLPLYAITLVVTFLADAILTGMLTAVVGHSVLGRKISIAEAWQLSWPRFRALIGSTLLAGLVVFGTLVVGGGVSVLIGAILIASHVTAVGVLLIVIGVLAVMIFTVIFWVRFAVAIPAVVLEGQGPGASLSRSWRLIRKSSWRVFGILLLTEVVVLVATGVLEIPFTVVSAILGHGSGGIFAFGGGASAGPSVAATIITAIGGIVAGSVTRPVLAGTRVLLYVDLRMRREGLDIVLQSATSQQGGAQAAAPEFGSVWDSQPAQTWQPGQGGNAGPPGQQRW